MSGWRGRSCLVLGTALALTLVGCTEGNVFSLEAGECFDDPTDATDVKDVPLVPCDEPHVNEAFFVFDLPDGDYPGDQEVQAQAAERCLEEFEGYVGVPYEESELEAFPITPSEQSWEEGDDRQVICGLYQPEEKLTGSMRASAP